jgi:hypothetical protein
MTEMTEIYGKFLRLYERLAEEREIVAKQGEALNKIIEILVQEARNSLEFKNKLRQRMAEDVEEATKALGEKLQTSVEKTLTREIKETIVDLHDAVKVNKRIYTRIKGKHIIAFVAGAFLAAVATGALMGHWIGQHRSVREMELYAKGERFERLLSKLDKKHRAFLNSLATYNE